MERIVGDREWIKRIPWFWRFQIGGWLVYALLSFPLKAVLFESLSYALLVTLTRESFGFLVTLALRYMYRKSGLRSDRPLLVAVLVLSLSFSFSALDTWLNLWVVDWIGRADRDDPLFGIFCFRALLFTAWSLLYFAIRDIMAARARLTELHKAELAARDAEILMLRAQVSPHFLFNAFNTILADLDGRDADLVPVVRGLSDYFRYSLANHDEVFVTMEKEYEAIRSYLTVEKARFGDSLEIDCQMDEAARDVAVPGIFLQPLVENALKYGHRTSPTPLRLRVNVVGDENGGAKVEVTNSGQWVEEDGTRARDVPGGQGLSVLRKRLEMLYPGTHELKIAPDEKEGTVTVCICIGSPQPYCALP
ncbi:MAG: histidine kinase [Luteolibacter sp.]